VAGIAAVLAAYLAYLTANRMSRAEDRTHGLAGQVGELESAIANQIQARMSAEEEARKANLRAADAALTNPLANRPVDDTTDLTDPQTGLFGEGYFLVSVEQRISAARRHLRPVAVALVEVVTDPGSDAPTHVDPSPVTEALAETLRDADTACRLSDGRFALILEDTPENGAICTIERLRRCLSDRVDSCTLWAGLSCYPAHGFDTDEILSQAQIALRSARDWPQDRIEVAESR
jgi:diguanylate cyclase (GGDEF)-like protein